MADEHEKGPRQGTVTDRAGKPIDLMSPAAAYPLLAECWTCGGQIELRSFYGLWQHAGPAALEDATMLATRD
jgi:hypothetical protein